MVSRREDKSTVTHVWNENSENVKRLSSDDREKVQEFGKKLAKLTDCYPVDEKPYSFIVDPKEFRESEIVRLKNVESNVTLVVASLSITLETGIFALFNGEMTSVELISKLTPVFENAKKWIGFVGNDDVECTFPIDCNMIDSLIKWNESQHNINSSGLEVVREILYSDTSIRDSITYIVETALKERGNKY